jgi:hypothetical protein
MIRIETEINGRPFVIEAPEGHSLEVEEGRIVIKPPFEQRPWYYFPGVWNQPNQAPSYQPYTITSTSDSTNQFPHFGGIPTNGNALVC